MIEYEKSDNKNIVKKIEKTETEIHLEQLRIEIEELEKEIDGMPKPKIKPDEDTLLFWNEMNVSNIEELKNQLENKKSLFKKIEAL